MEMTVAYSNGAWANHAGSWPVALRLATAFTPDHGLLWLSAAQFKATEREVSATKPPCTLPANAQCDATSATLPKVARAPAPRLPHSALEERVAMPLQLSDVTRKPSLPFARQANRWAKALEFASKSKCTPARPFV